MCSVKDLTQRQRDILDFIHQYREDAGFPPSVREIGERFGLAPATVQDHIKALERKGSLERRPHRSRSLSPVARGGPIRGRIDGIPVVGRVAAGAPILAEENLEDILSLPEGWASPGSFLLRVQGESMRDAHILDGDLVLVRPQESASNGEIVVALIDDEATVKRFRKTADGIELVAENPDFGPIRVRAGQGLRVRIVGRVTGVFRTSVDRHRRR